MRRMVPFCGGSSRTGRAAASALPALLAGAAVFIRGLDEQRVGCSVHWRPLHLHPYYSDHFGWTPELLPVASREWPRLVSLPLFPGMSDAEHDHVVSAVRTLCRRWRTASPANLPADVTPWQLTAERV